MDDDKFAISEILSFENDLFNKTKILYDNLIESENKRIDLIEFRISELFTLKQKLDLYLSITEEYNHYEITSLLSFWDNTFHEIKQVIENNDSNTSWMFSQFNNYAGQHEIVDRMLRNQIN